MATQPLESQLNAKWTGGFFGKGEIETKEQTIQFTLPEEFNGQGKYTDPEELLLSSVSSCLIATIGIVAEKRGVTIGEIHVNSKLTVETSFPPKIEQIDFHLSHSSTIDDASFLDICESAKSMCLISNAVKGNVSIQIHVSTKGENI